jgi:hypothetical protein
VVRLGTADDRGADHRIAQDPGEGDLGHGDAAGLDDLLDGLDDGLVERRVEGPDDGIDIGAVRLLPVRARQSALALRREGHRPHPHIGAHRHQLLLVLPA